MILRSFVSYSHLFSVLGRLTVEIISFIHKPLYLMKQALASIAIVLLLRLLVSSLVSIPRVVTYDAKTGTNILQWPVEELETLRTVNTNFDEVILPPGSLINLNISSAAQLDITAEFKADEEAVKAMVPVGDNVIYKCSPAAAWQALGSFGLVVLADDSLSELTPVYFHVAKASDGTLKH